MNRAMADGGVEICPSGEVSVIGKAAFQINNAAGFQDPLELAENGMGVVEMFDDFNHHDAIDRSVGNIFQLDFGILVDADGINLLSLQKAGGFALTTAKIYHASGKTAQSQFQTLQTDQILIAIMSGTVTVVFS